MSAVQNGSANLSDRGRVGPKDRVAPTTRRDRKFSTLVWSGSR